MKTRFGSLLCIVFILLFTLPSKALALRGDTNCDNNINFDDIDPFIKALSGQAVYQAAYPNCQWLNADANNNGTVNFDDIDPFIALLSSCGSNQAPLANAGADQTGQAGETLTFNGSGSSDPDGTSGNLSYNWQFGDNSSAQGVIVSHSYNQPGTYTVSLRVQDPCGAEATDTVNVNIVSQVAQVPPVPSFYVYSQPTLSMAAHFKAEVFDFHEHTTHQYVWNFGDGSAPLLGENLSEVYHTYTALGPRTVTLSVTDPLGLQGTTSLNLTVYPAGTLQANFVIEYLADKDLISGAETWQPVGLSASDPIESGQKVRFNGTLSIGTETFRWRRGSSSIGTTPIVKDKAFSGPQEFDLRLLVYGPNLAEWVDVTKRVYVAAPMALATPLEFPTPLGVPADATLIGSRLWVAMYTAVYTSDFSSPTSPTPLEAVPVGTLTYASSITDYEPAGGPAFVLIVDRPTGIAIHAADPVAPTLIGRLGLEQLGGVYPTGARCLGKWLFVSTLASARLYVFDLTPLLAAGGPAMPQFVTTIDVPLDEVTTMIPSPDGVLVVRNDWRPEVYFIDARGGYSPFQLPSSLHLQAGLVDRGAVSHGLAAVRDSLGMRLIRLASTPDGNLPLDFLGPPLPVSTGYMAMTRQRLYLFDNTQCKIFKYDITNPAAPYVMTSTSSLLWTYGAGLIAGNEMSPAASLIIPRHDGFNIFTP